MTLDLSYFREKINSVNPKLKFMHPSFIDGASLLKSDKILNCMELLSSCVQKMVCDELEALDGSGRFAVERWENPSITSGGVTCVIQGASIIEKAGVNVSSIQGKVTPQMLRAMRERGHDVVKENYNFSATGVSSVIHPRNPHCPTVHFNFRYFEIAVQEGEPPVHWFGGGCDITPYYVYPEDIGHFHRTLKLACDRNDSSYYPKFKKWADEYFYIPHREETRGLGGIFFDDLTGSNMGRILNFVVDCALSVIPAFLPILWRRHNQPYTAQENEWKCIRRGRYVEFNIMYDRGTRFGLMTPGARIESILMSLPPNASWQYCHQPKEGSKEMELLGYTKCPVEWS